MVNVEQAAAWDGEEGDRWADQSDRYLAAARSFDPWLTATLRLADDAQVLDVGCGLGASSRHAARLVPRGEVVGIDLSSRLVREARRRAPAEGLTNTTFVQGDAQVYPFGPETFDVALSRFGVMFFNDPAAAFANIGRALRPGGRLAFLCWQDLAENEWVLAIRDALAMGRRLPEPPRGAPGLFGLAQESAIRRVLGSAGYRGIELTHVKEPVSLGSDAGDAFDFVTGMGSTRAMLGDLDDGARAGALNNLRRTLPTHASADGVMLAGSAWLVTATRGEPDG